MTYQITIGPTLVTKGNYICPWHIEQIISPTTNTVIEAGKIEMELDSKDHISNLAEKISELSNITSKKHNNVELKFNLSPVGKEEKGFNTIDLFKLYGLLSMKLKPSTINVCR